MSGWPTADDDGFDREVVVVGGGPAGSAAAVFTARADLETLVFDRGPGALPRCAYLENYPGFPAGIDVQTFQELLAAHLQEAGAERVAEQVTAVERRGDGGFTVETQDGTEVATAHVIAATWYDGSYLRGLEGEGMFAEEEHHGELEERFDPEYPDADGRTPIDGLYVASPAGDRSAQAVVAAGNGAHVARALLEDRRRERGLAGDVAPRFDWLRRDAEFSGEWADRDRWRTFFEREVGKNSDLPDDRIAELREAYVERAFATRRTPAEVEELAERGLERLVDVVGPERVLRAVDDDLVRERARALAADGGEAGE